jgi:hypothetical protein
MYYSYVEIEYVATSFSPARTDLALKLLKGILEMLQQGWSLRGELIMNIRRWVHLRQIIPTIHHFLSRLSFLKQQAENKQQINIDKQRLEDLLFLLFVLVKCHQGIDLNLIAFQQPIHVYRLDSCPASLGG